MSDQDRELDKKSPRTERQTANSEEILMALDQISQTIEVMSGVVGRLRTYVEEQEFNDAATVRRALRSKRTLH